MRDSILTTMSRLPGPGPIQPVPPIIQAIVSYRKEERGEKVTYNLIGILRLSGMPAQEAFDHTGTMLETRYQNWAAALATLPSWGGTIHQDVQKYIRSVKNNVLANLNWSQARQCNYCKG